MYGYELGYMAAILDMRRAQDEYLSKTLIKQIHEDTLAAYEIAKKQHDTQSITDNESFHEIDEFN